MAAITTAALLMAAAADGSIAFTCAGNASTETASSRTVEALWQARLLSMTVRALVGKHVCYL